MCNSGRKKTRHDCTIHNVLRARNHKPGMLTQAASDEMRIIDGEKNISEIAHSPANTFGVEHPIALKRVNVVNDEPRKLGADCYE